MLIRRSEDIPSSEITAEGIYVNRRQFIGKSMGVALGGVIGETHLRRFVDPPRRNNLGQQKDWSSVRSDLDEKLTPYEDVTSYNNFYEFGTGKSDPLAIRRQFPEASPRLSGATCISCRVLQTRTSISGKARMIFCSMWPMV